MDPRVYLVLLKRYASLPRYDMRYEIDIRLKRYESALRHLVRMGDDEEEEENGTMAATTTTNVDTTRATTTVTEMTTTTTPLNDEA